MKQKYTDRNFENVFKLQDYNPKAKFFSAVNKLAEGDEVLKLLLKCIVKENQTKLRCDISIHLGVFWALGY